MKKIVILVNIFLLSIVNAFSVSNEFIFVAGKNVYKNDKIVKVFDSVYVNDKIVCGPYSFCSLSFNDVKIFMYPQTAICINTNLKKSDNYKTTVIEHLIGKIKIESKNTVIIQTVDKIISFENSSTIVNVGNKLTTIKNLNGLVDIYFSNNLLYNNKLQLLEDLEKPICSLLKDFYFNGVEYSERSIPLYYKKIEIKEEED